MKNFDKLHSNDNNSQNLQGPYAGMFKSMLAGTGKYHYLTCLMATTAGFFFWMTPNHHKIRLIKPKKMSTEKYIINGNKVIHIKDDSDML